MFKKGIVFTALVLSSLHLGTVSAWAQDPMPTPLPTPPADGGAYTKACRRWVETFDKINFSDTQAQTVAQFLIGFRNGMHDLGPELSLARLGLVETIFNSTEYNERVVRDAVANLSLVETEVIVLYSKVVQNIKQIVTPTQYKLMLKGSLELYTCSKGPLIIFHKYLNKWILEHQSL